MLDDIVLPLIRTQLETIVADAGVPVICYVDQRVPARYGARLVANVYPGPLNAPVSPDWQHGAEFLMGFRVGITERTGQTPPDRLWDAAMATKLVPLGRTIFEGLSELRYDLQATINTALDTQAPGWKLVEPFTYKGRGLAVEAVGPEHFFADPGAANARTDYGMWTMLDYGGGRFVISHLS